MKITKAQTIEAVRGWIASSNTPEQLTCCLMFVTDTLWTRFEAEDEVKELKLLIATKMDFNGISPNPLRVACNSSII